MVRRALLAATLLVLVGAADAHACSCLYTTPRDALRTADHAFTGRLVDVRRQWRMHAVYTFEVERVLKGTIGERIRIRAHGKSSSCWLEVRVGERAGLILDRDRHGRWTGSFCNRYGARQLRDAARGMSRTASPQCPAEDADFQRALKRLSAVVSQPLLPAPLLDVLEAAGGTPI
jgi:hypothetical protein